MRASRAYCVLRKMEDDGSRITATHHASPLRVTPLRLVAALAMALAGVIGLWLSLTSPSSAYSPQPQGPLLDIQISVDEVVASFLVRPLQVTHAGDGSGRLFVVEQGGYIRVIQAGRLLDTPFLNIEALVTCCDERGLLGLAFHPAYEQNGYFYVNYTRRGDGATVIARFQVSGDPNLADPGTGKNLLIIAQPDPMHNGGQLAFGPDGYLYIGMGDGGGFGDPHNNAQNIETLLGALLRIDVDHGDPYAIPPDNPYVAGPGRDEIWAIGLRNPWRFSFDRATGDLYLGDVGQDRSEEIDYQAAGAPGGLNYGWDCKEGTYPFSTDPPCNDPAHLAGLTGPIHEYSRGLGQSATGGFVYRGSRYPRLAGRYFFADFVSGRIWSMVKTGSNPPTWSVPELELTAGFSVSSFGEGDDGELYVVGYSDGSVRRLTDATQPGPNLADSHKSASTGNANPGETITYTLLLVNTGDPSPQTLRVTDTVPAGLEYVAGSLIASQGSADDSQAPLLRWQGPFPAAQGITITYRAAVAAGVQGGLVNQAQIRSPAIPPITLTHTLFVPRSLLGTTPNDFFLPGTQPGHLLADIPASITCDFCHTASIYNRWRGSMMSQSGRDPLLWAALTVANNDAPHAGEYCLRCHAPKGWLAGRSHPADGSALQPDDLSDGVACEVCHRLVDPIPSPADETAAIDAGVRGALTSTVPIGNPGSAMLIVDPADNRRGPFSFATPLPYHTTFRTAFLGQSSHAVSESRMCGACHNVDNPALSWDEARGQFWPNDAGLAAPSFEDGDLFPIETTFDEWLNSEYAARGVFAPQFAGEKPDGIVRSCQDCHMRRTAGAAAEDSFNPVPRDCLTTGCLPEHELVGGNTWLPHILQDVRWRLHSPASEAGDLNASLLSARAMLRKAATLIVTLTTSAEGKAALVRVTNQTGHKLPTGYPEGRRMWINLRAYNATGELIYESGAYDPATGVLVEEPGAKVYEAKQAIAPELAQFLNLPAGASFHFILNNTVVKDNRIPPRGYTQAAYDRPGLRPVEAAYADGQYWDETTYPLPAGAERVVATLYYQTASKEYIDFLRANGGADGSTLGALWDSSKSPPEVIAMALSPSYPIYLPVIMKES